MLLDTLFCRVSLTSNIKHRFSHVVFVFNVTFLAIAFVCVIWNVYLLVSFGSNVMFFDYLVSLHFSAILNSQHKVSSITRAKARIYRDQLNFEVTTLTNRRARKIVKKFPFMLKISH